MILKDLPQIITAIGGIGTASFGLVEASKAFLGSINKIGFDRIKSTLTGLTPDTDGSVPRQKNIMGTVEANWINGTDLASQKAIAKSLIKLHLNSGNTQQLAAATGVDAAVLSEVAKCISSGTALSPAQSDVFARFDLIVTTLLDETYQRSDHDYRNWTRALAAIVAVVISLLGGLMLEPSPSWHNIGVSLLVGLLATPLAPIAKDLSTMLASTVNTLQLVKK